MVGTLSYDPASVRPRPWSPCLRYNMLEHPSQGFGSLFCFDLYISVALQPISLYNTPYTDT